MSNPVLLVPDGEAVYAIPVEEAKKHALKGEELTSAIEILSEESDVTGQNRPNGYYFRRNSRGQAYQRDSGGQWRRAPAYD